MLPDEPHIAPDDGADAASPTPDSADHGSKTHRAPLLSRPHRPPSALVGGFAAIVVVVLLALMFTTFARGRIGKADTKASGMPTAQQTDDPTFTAVPTITAGHTPGVGSPTASPDAGGTGSSGGAGDQPSPTSTGQGMRVTGLSLAVDRTSFNGICNDQMSFNFTLTVSIAPGSEGGSVDYQVVPSDSVAQGFSSNLLFGNVDTTEITTFGETLSARNGDGATHWIQVQITSPNAATSQKISFALTCIREVTSATASVTPDVWNAPCAANKTFNFTFTINLTPGPPVSVTFSPNSSGGFREWQPPSSTFSDITGYVITFSGPGTLYWLPDSLGGGNGTYWKSITVTAPNTVTSNQATITKNC